jgi:muramoyltetrapeptide carboxypeptidase
MNRKHFLSALATTAIVLPSFSGFAKKKVDPSAPPYLRRGDVIGITCPAGSIKSDEIAASVRIMESWGFKIRIGSTVNKADFTFGGTDEERFQDFQSMLDDPSVKAIMCARGGYGSARIIDRLNFSKFIEHPKWIIGFSDITVLHCHINRLFGIATLHSKMCNSFPDDFSKSEPIIQDTILSIKKALTGERMSYTSPASSYNRPGSASGILIGGNLSMIQSVAATVSEPNTIGKILFLEEVEEHLYTIDRMFNNLQRSHKLDSLSGLIIGGFARLKPDDPGKEFGRSVYDIVLEKIKGLNFPVCFDFPVGHQRNNYALKCGVMHHLNVNESGASLFEIE